MDWYKMRGGIARCAVIGHAVTDPISNDLSLTGLEL